MRLWASRLILLLTIGGSFAGLTQVLLAAPSAFTQGTTAILDCVALLAYCLWGLLIGLALAEGRGWEKQLVAFLSLQIPRVSVPGWFSYHIGAGLYVFAGYIKKKYGIAAGLGVQMSLGDAQAWEWGVNLVPIALIALLRRSNNRWRGP